MAEEDEPPSSEEPLRPTMTLPPRTSILETLFTGWPDTGPDPVTLASNLFSDNDLGSLSQLLAGGMNPPAAVPTVRQSIQPSSGERDSGAGNVEFSQVPETQQTKLIIPPGLSPEILLDSPDSMLDFPASQDPFGLSQQQILSQAAQAQTQIHIPAEYPSLSSSQLQSLEPGTTTAHQQILSQFTFQTAQAQAQMHNPAEYPSLSSLQLQSLEPGTTTAHQQILSQATFQAAQAPAQTHIPAHEYNWSLFQSLDSGTTVHQQLSMPFPVAAPDIMKESSDIWHADRRSQPSITIADDGYNWRCVSQYREKGSQYPHRYQQCTHSGCLARRKIVMSRDGQVSDILLSNIRHFHQPPQPIKPAKGTGNPNINCQGNSESGSIGWTGNLYNSKEGLKDQESSQATPEQVSGSREREKTEKSGRHDDSTELKRRKIEVQASVPASFRRKYRISNFPIRTARDEVDGYKWLKHSEKGVSGSPYRRCYYKGDSEGCKVRKQVQQASSDPKDVAIDYNTEEHEQDPPADPNSRRKKKKIA